MFKTSLGKLTGIGACTIDFVQELQWLEQQAVLLGERGAIISLMARLLRTPEQILEESRGLLQIALPTARAGAAAIRPRTVLEQRRWQCATRPTAALRWWWTGSRQGTGLRLFPTCTEWTQKRLGRGTEDRVITNILCTYYCNICEHTGRGHSAWAVGSLLCFSRVRIFNEY